jgi:hypothetical protein
MCPQKVGKFIEFLFFLIIICSSLKDGHTIDMIKHIETCDTVVWEYKKNIYTNDDFYYVLLQILRYASFWKLHAPLIYHDFIFQRNVVYNFHTSVELFLITAH